MDAVGAFRDLVEGFELAPLWSRLGWEQTVARFRRTILGPFWLTANLLAISFALAFVNGALSGAGYRDTFPLIIGGVLTWGLLGTVVAEAAGIFIVSAGLMHTMRLPLSFHILLMMHRTFINFVAQLLAFWLVLVVMHLGALPTWPILIGLPLVLANMTLMGLLVAVPSTRFRDIHQTVQFVIQMLFFMTPIFWSPANAHGQLGLIVMLNPFTHLLELVREPLLGRTPALADWEWCVALLGAQFLAVIVVLGLFRKRVVFWL
jgi:ABC-2 type transport system permease protein